MASPLGEILVAHGALTRSQLGRALRHHRSGGCLGSTLVELGYVSSAQISAALQRLHRVPGVDLDFLSPPDPEVVDLIPPRLAIRSQILPLLRVGSTLVVATADPANVALLDDLKFRTGLFVEPVVTPEAGLRRMIDRTYGAREDVSLRKLYDRLPGPECLDLSPREDPVDLDELYRSSSQRPVIQLANIILAESIRQGASDIHLESSTRQFRVRYRVDGVLFTVMTPPARLREALISRLKIMASLDISQRRLPQDGRFKIRIHNQGLRREIDFRISCLPTLSGEKLVLRLLDPAKLPPALEDLGLETQALDRLRRAIGLPHGMVLVSGPTGSGKTTTLYTCLNQLNTPEVNILTVEDPVEFNFPGINQVQANHEVGLTFPAALRAFLRQDPNIMLVGEIRDSQTAQVATRASLTGHLVLSTVHTNDACATVDRLLDMGIERFLVAGSLRLVCAQRLVRRICDQCREKVTTEQETLLQLGYSRTEIGDLEVWRGRGCSRCRQTGYRGRTGVFEILEVGSAVRRKILGGAQGDQLRQTARGQGMLTLRESGLAKIRKGITTPEEVARETMVH